MDRFMATEYSGDGTLWKERLGKRGLGIRDWGLGMKMGESILFREWVWDTSWGG